MPEFESLEAIDKHFGKEIKAAADDEDKVRGLNLEKREAVADFRDRQATRRELDAHRKSLLTGVDWPDEVKEMLAGESIDALDASHARLSAMVLKLTGGRTSDDAAAQRMYGEPIGAGGGTPPPPRQTDEDRFEQEFADRFNGRDPSKPVTVNEINRFIRQRSGKRALQALSETSPKLRGVDLSSSKR